MSALDTRLRGRLIDAGLLRPNGNELPPTQLPPGTPVYRVSPTPAESRAEHERGRQ